MAISNKNQMYHVNINYIQTIGGIPLTNAHKSLLSSRGGIVCDLRAGKIMRKRNASIPILAGIEAKYQSRPADKSLITVICSNNVRKNKKGLLLEVIE